MKLEKILLIKNIDSLKKKARKIKIITGVMDRRLQDTLQ